MAALARTVRAAIARVTPPAIAAGRKCFTDLSSLDRRNRHRGALPSSRGGSSLAPIADRPGWGGSGVIGGPKGNAIAPGLAQLAGFARPSSWFLVLSS